VDELVPAAAVIWAGRHGDPGRRIRCGLPGDRLIEGVWHDLPADGLRALTVRDLTGDVRIRRRLREHNRALAELVATKTELVSALLHELRTPLAAARSMAEMLPPSLGDPLLDEALRAVARNLDRIGAVTGEIATVSGIENGTIDLVMTAFDLPELLAQVARRLNTSVVVTGTDGGVDGDRERLAEAFDRLIAAVQVVSGNAPSAVHASREPDQWRVALPLPPDGTADQLFTATGSRSNATALMLARAVVGRHGGTVGIESDGGVPALTVRLPVALPATSAPTPG
jgi:signal transduction histidine kinase